MAILKFDETPFRKVREGVHRKLICTDNLMTVYIEFTNGPWENPDPPHAHPHEQITFVAEGEIIFCCEGEDDYQLKQGDMFAVPSGKLHTIKLLTEKVVLIDSFNPIREDFLK